MTVKLQKELSWWDCSGIIVGIILGTGIFSAFPGLVAMQNASSGLVLLAWIAGGLFAWFGAMCYAELSSLFPHAGGDYTFLHKAYSLKGESIVSFLFAWSQVFVIRPASIAILSLMFSKELQVLFPSFSQNVWNPVLLYAIGLILVTTLLNIIGVGVGKHTQNITTAIKIAILLFIIIYGIVKPAETQVSLQPFFLPENKSFLSVFGGFISAIVLVMWVYGGWNEAAYVAEEVKNPHHDIPKALFFGVFTTTILYVGINYVFLKYFSPSGLSKTFTPSSDLMGVWFREKGRIVMSTIIMVSAAGAVNGLTLTGGRMIHGIARSTKSLSYFSKLHPRFKTPLVPLVGNLVLTLILLFISNGSTDFIDNLTFYTAGVYWYFFSLVVISLIIFRTKLTRVEIPFRVPLYPAAPIIFLIVSGILIWGSFDYKPFETLAGISILTVGIPLYYLMHFNRPENSLHLTQDAFNLDDDNDERRQNTFDRRQNEEDRRKNKQDRRKVDLGRERASD